MPTIANLRVYEGEDRTLTLYARDQSNLPLSLTGATIQWRIGHPPYQKDSSGTSLSKTATISDSTNGIFTVAISAVDTQFMTPGDYLHQSWITTASAQTYLINEGRFRIRPWNST
ncbi:MAG TPA: hypothetical protein VF501_06675 [Thiobacillus sp.]